MQLEAYRIQSEPYYLPVGAEVALFEAAYASRLPVMLKGPTGSGKTRFVEYMAWKLQRPLITVAAHEDMTAADLAGRFLLAPEGTVWHDGPLTLAVRYGAICYLDEIVEARQDTTVVIHPLTDARRILPLEKKNELVTAHPDFQLVISYNPGYQSAVKGLKNRPNNASLPSTSIIRRRTWKPKSSAGNRAPTARPRGGWSISRCGRGICAVRVWRRAPPPYFLVFYGFFASFLLYPFSTHNAMLAWGRAKPRGYPQTSS